MPPKVRITKKEIVAAAVGLVRSRGEEALNARELAGCLGCSTQPIFSNFASMEQVRQAVVDAAEETYGEYVCRENESGKYPPYKASGMAYIRFAREEKELFRLLFMRDRTGEAIPEQTDMGDRAEEQVRRNTGLDPAEAKLFHLEMWAFVHGIASMTATGYLDLEWELVSRMLTDSYQGLKSRFGKE